MASSFKTENFSLNNWAGTDKPQRADFNSDNSIIDAVLHEHITDMSLHTTPEDKRQNETFAYLGNGAATQTLTFDFAPDAVIVMALNKGIAEYKNSVVKSYAGMAGSTMASSGISVSGKNVTVKQESSYTGASSLQCLNETGITYLIIALRSYHPDY